MLLPPTPTLRTTNLSRLTLGLPLMMPTTQHPQILRTIIIMDGITNLMVNLIPIPSAQANIPVIILDRPLAPMPIPFKNHRTDTRPIRIEPFITMGTRPRHNASTKTGLAGAEQENTPKGKHPSRKSSQINQPKCSGRDSNPHTLQVAHFECAASTIPPPKQKNKRPTLHPQQEHGTLVQPPESHKEPMASSQWLFTASHGARMLRESNPRTVPGRHLSKVVQ